jgi:Lrp/AsnC family transcriptional regulator for asnA, asnC and gidA
MDILDEFDVKIIKELEKDGRIAYSTIATNLKISNTMVHQRINRLFEQGIITGIKPILNEKQIGYDWASFTGITLNKDSDSERIKRNSGNYRMLFCNGFVYPLFKDYGQKPRTHA